MWKYQLSYICCPALLRKEVDPMAIDMAYSHVSWMQFDLQIATCFLEKTEPKQWMELLWFISDIFMIRAKWESLGYRVPYWMSDLSCGMQTQDTVAEVFSAERALSLRPSLDDFPAWRPQYLWMVFVRHFCKHVAQVFTTNHDKVYIYLHLIMASLRRFWTSIF